MNKANEIMKLKKNLLSGVSCPNENSSFLDTLENILIHSNFDTRFKKCKKLPKAIAAGG